MQIIRCVAVLCCMVHVLACQTRYHSQTESSDITDVADTTSDPQPNEPQPPNPQEPNPPPPISPPTTASEYETETCTNTLNTATTNGCSVTPGDSNLVLYGTVLGIDRVYKNGSVVLNNAGHIMCVGCSCAAQFETATKIICNQTVISPGLINAHDHIGWMGDRPLNLNTNTVRYEHRHDWRLGDPSQQEPILRTKGGASNQEKAWGELRFVLAGATSVNGSGESSGLLRNLDKASGREGLSGPANIYEVFPLGDSSGAMRTLGCNYPSMPDLSRIGNAPYTPHVAEGINLSAHNELTCLTHTAFQGENILGPSVAMIHGIATTPIDLSLMAANGTKLIWSPRSNVALYGTTASIPVAIRTGVTVALGTDWIPSGSMNMLRELACAEYLSNTYWNHALSAYQLWKMATVHAAMALGVESQIGSLRQGLEGDIVLFSENTNETPFESVIHAHPKNIRLVMRQGTILTGDTSIIEQLETPNCDTLNVCGNNKSVCLSHETAWNLEQLQNAVSASIYPLFYCDTPSDEPTCVPYRESDQELPQTSYTQGPHAEDIDGDGIPNNTDNCPSMFNPILGYDNGVQADFDQDGVGDMCDPCVLHPNTTTCGAFFLDDPDADGVIGTRDNCPEKPNRLQEDSDRDGHGDVCDPCMNAPNPGAQGCPASVYDIAQGILSEDSLVSVSDVVVTAIGPSGYYAQLIETSESYDPILQKQYSGIYVYEGNHHDTSIHVGDHIHIESAFINRYRQNIQLTDVIASVIDHDDVLPVPFELQTLTTTTQAAPYLYLLVELGEQTVRSVKAANTTTRPPQEAEILFDSGAIMTSGAGYMPLELGAGDMIAHAAGILMTKNSNIILMPRKAAEVGTALPAVSGFSSNRFFIRPGSNQTLPNLLTLKLARASTEAVSVRLSSSHNNVLMDPVVIFNAGEQEKIIAIRASNDFQIPTEVTILAQLGRSQAQTTCVVIPENSMPEISQLQLSNNTLVVGRSYTLTISFSFPIPSTGAELHLTTDGFSNTAFNTNIIQLPSNSMQATAFFSPSEASAGNIVATLGNTSLALPVLVTQPAAVTLDISGYRITQTDSAAMFVIPNGTVLNTGAYVIIARNTSKANFERFWNLSLPSNVLFINSADKFPKINGDEVFNLATSSGTILGNASPALVAERCYIKDTTQGTWSYVNATPALANIGQTASPSAKGAFITEICDAIGPGTYNYEFVSLYYGGIANE